MTRVFSGVTEALTGDSIPALSSLYGTPCFIGVSSGASDPPVVKTMDRYSDITNLIGSGRLARHLQDFFACAGQRARALVYAHPGDVDGSMVINTQTIGAPTIDLENSDPTYVDDIYIIDIQCVTGGLDPVTLKYSLDGKKTWKTETPGGVVGSKVLQIEECGDLYIVFDDSINSFSPGQLYQVQTFPRTMSAGEITAAIDAVLADYRALFEFFVIVEWPDAAMATAINAKITAEWSNHNPIFGILDNFPVPYEMKDDELANYIAEMQDFSSRYMAICLLDTLSVSVDGVNRARSVAGSMAGILNKGKVSDSVGVLRNEHGKLVNAISLSPANVTEADAVLAVNAGFCAPRRYVGRPGFYINNASLMSAPGDPFDDVEKIRVAGKLLRLCRAAALNCLHLDAASGGKYAFAGRGGLDYLQAELERAVAPMLVAEELMYFKAHVLSTPDEVYADNTVRVRLDFTTNPKMKIIELVADLVSPDEFARRNA